MYSEYSYEAVDEKINYTYDTPERYWLKKLRSRYRIDQIAGDNGEFRQMSNLMVWVYDTLKYDGELIIDTHKFNSLNIISRTEKKGISSNCWMYATVLNEVFLAMGFKSRRIRCMSADLEDKECHCVTIVYSNEFNKWIMFDAANKAFFVDKQALPMSLQELRESLITEQKIYLPKATTSDFEKIKRYWYKNIVRFQAYSHSAFNFESSKKEKKIYNLNPKAIVVEDKVTFNNRVKQNYINISNPNIFWRI